MVGGWVCLFIFENFIWQVLLGDRVSHGFWVGLFLLVSLGVTYGVVIMGASVGIRFVSQKFGIDTPLKSLCSGAFLGPPAVVGLLALLNVPWEIFGKPNLILALLIPVLKDARVYYFVTDARLGFSRFAGRNLVYPFCPDRGDIGI